MQSHHTEFSNMKLDMDNRSHTVIRIKPAEFFARTLAHQVRKRSTASVTLHWPSANHRRYSPVDPSAYIKRTLQLCASICQAHPANYNAKRLLDSGSKLLRQAFGLAEMCFAPDSGHADVVSICWYVIIIVVPGACVNTAPGYHGGTGCLARQQTDLRISNQS